MLSKLLKLIGAQPEEENQVKLLLANGFFMGIFLATYKVAAEAIFLSTFKGDYIQEAFVAAGLLGVISTLLFSRLQNVVKFSRLAIFNLLFLAVISFGLWIMFGFTNGEYLAFAAFTFLGPITAIVLLGFWGVFNRMFDLRKAKRIIGGIDTGQLSATILVSFAIPVVLPLINLPSQHLFLASSISIVISMLFMIRIVTKYDIDKIKKRSKEELKESSFGKMIKSKYVILLSVFVLLSITILKFVDYSFFRVVQMQFPTESALTSFIAAINGMVMVLSFLIQTFINDKIIGDYGLKVSLMVMPVILLIFTALAILTDTFGGSGIEDSSFWLFFLFISLSKLFTTSLKDALENPAFKLYFMPLDIKIRFDIQAKIEGVVAELAALVAGGLTLLIAIFYSDLGPYSYVTMVVGALMIFVIGKLYFEYRNALKNKLSVPGADIALNRTDQSIPFILENGVKSKNTHTVINSLEVMEKLEPMLLEDNLNHVLKGNDKLALEYVIKKLNNLNQVKSLNYLEKLNEDFDPGLQEINREVMTQFKQMVKFGNSESTMRELAESRYPMERVLALRLVEVSEKKEFYHFVHTLIRDLHPLVRINALITAAKLKDRVFWHAIIDNLSLPAYTNTAMGCLVYIGEPVLNDLDHVFNKSGQRLNILSRIIRIYGRIGGNYATELLWKKAEFPEPLIVTQVFSALSQSGYQATPNYRGRIKDGIDEDISKVAWNISAINELPTDQLGRMVRSSLLEENETIYRHIYMLLAMIYEDLSIKLVRENIETGNSEDLTYAIELLDIFLEDDLKPKLYPLIDDLPDSERVRRLQLQYPRDSFDEFEVLNQIINRDYNKINKWTKACALYHLGHHKESSVSDILIANIFNPDTLLRETAAWAIYNIDQELYEIHSLRLDPGIKKGLDEMIVRHRNMDRYALLFHKVLFVKTMKLFKGVPSVILSRLVHVMIEEVYDEGYEIVKEGRYNISSFYVIESGHVKITDGFDHEIMLGSGQFFGASLLTDPNENTYSVQAMSEVRVFRVKREQFYRFLSRNYQVIEKMIQIERIFGKEEMMA